MRIHKVMSMLLALALAGATFGLLGGAGIASAASARPAHRGVFICAGTFKSPGVLAGRHRNVVVRGVCAVNAGRARVVHRLSVARHGVLLAAFALNDRTHHGRSSLVVGGNLIVRRGAALALGCQAAHFPCIDDPNPKHPTLSSRSFVAGNLLAFNALGVLVHDSVIGDSVLQAGGGGGRNCTPQGIFTAFKSPVFSDYENSWIGGSLVVAGLRSCWFGALRDHVRGSVLVVANKMADPDANEVLTNRIRHDIACFGNSPAIQYGDSHGSPNLVGRHAFGQCGFRVRKPNPAPHGPLTPISVRA